MSTKICIFLLFSFFMTVSSVSGFNAILSDYPSAYTLFQRDNSTTGTIKIVGHFDSHIYNVTGIEASFNGNSWQLINASPSTDGKFTGNLTASVGQGTLSLKASNDNSITGEVANISVGDLFLITGQSNANGRGIVQYNLSSSNPFIGVKYMPEAQNGHAAGWSEGSDFSSNRRGNGSAWPRLLQVVIPSQDIPVGFIAAAIGGTSVVTWNKYSTATSYNKMLSIANKATNGSMKIKAVIYYQGEADTPESSDYYKGNLIQMINGFNADFGVPILIGQINGKNESKRGYYYVARAQKESWGVNNTKMGAVTWDLCPDNGVHFSNDSIMGYFADRWIKAVLREVYGNTSFNSPNLTAAYFINSTTIRLVYDTNLTISDFYGTSGGKARGFDIVDRTKHLSDSQIVSTIISNNVVTLNLNSSITPSAFLSIGSGGYSDYSGAKVLRSSSNGQVVPMEFNRTLQGS